MCLTDTPTDLQPVLIMMCLTDTLTDLQPVLIKMCLTDTLTDLQPVLIMCLTDTYRCTTSTNHDVSDRHTYRSTTSA